MPNIGIKHDFRLIDRRILTVTQVRPCRKSGKLFEGLVHVGSIALFTVDVEGLQRIGQILSMTV